MSSGYRIQYQSCPRCAIRRTVSVGDGSSFCFNCRLQWRLLRDHSVCALTSSAFGVERVDPIQQARFAIYRSAVRAGFYTDVLASPAMPD